MIHPADLRHVARARLRDAQALLGARRFNGAMYVCGYAVELALKARICRTLKWSGFPQTSHEFMGLQSMRTHNLDTLLHLSGVEGRVRGEHMWLWSEILAWSPEKRYQTTQSTSREASVMIAAAVKLLEVL
jgi:hypothetical protein